MKHIGAIVLFALVVLTPIAPSSSEPHPVTKLAAKAKTAGGLTLEERVALLEERAREHEAEDKTLEGHMTQHIDDMLRSQGAQDDKINSLQSKQQVVYSVGEGIGWLISIIITVFFVYSSRRYREAKERHEAIQQTLKSLDDRCVAIEKAILVLSDRSDRLTEEERHARVAHGERLDKRMDRVEDHKRDDDDD